MKKTHWNLVLPISTTNDKSPDSNASAENSQIETGSQESDSKFFAIRTTGGQEHIVVNLAQNRINSKKIPSTFYIVT